MEELNKRVLADVDTCKRVWQSSGDPLAICEAIRQSQLPEWLADAVLVLLADGAKDAKLLRTGWRRRTRDAVDAERAGQVASMRSHPTHPQTWDLALKLADESSRSRYDDMPAVSSAALRKSYQRVVKELPKDPLSFHHGSPGLSARITKAYFRELGISKEELGTKTSDK